MSIVKRFLSYSEIKTKITSVLTFLMVIAYLYSSGRSIDFIRSVVFFLGMLFFDLTATTINNYCDTKNNHQTLQFHRHTARIITIFLLLVSIGFGLYLVYLTDFVVLLLGGICFLFGIFYSFGPIPISHGPYGEIISGFFYGLLIPTILVYINTPPGELLAYAVSSGELSFRIDIMLAAEILILSVVPFCLTANIMLANNICDVEHDVRVNRFTLPYYLKKKALTLFAGLYYSAYLSVVVLVFLKLVSPLSLLLLITLIPVQKNINRFYERQIKEETFIVAIQNYIIIIVSHSVLMFIGSFLPGWGPR